jgi:hypothetical protein
MRVVCADTCFAYRFVFKTVGESLDPPGDFAKQNHTSEGGIPLFPFGKSKNYFIIFGGRVKTLPYYHFQALK